MLHTYDMYLFWFPMFVLLSVTIHFNMSKDAEMAYWTLVFLLVVLSTGIYNIQQADKTTTQSSQHKGGENVRKHK